MADVSLRRYAGGLARAPRLAFLVAKTGMAGMSPAPAMTRRVRRKIYADLRFDRSWTAACATAFNPPSVVLPFLALSFSLCATYFLVS